MVSLGRTRPPFRPTDGSSFSERREGVEVRKA
jgi:hypothetical protein